MSLSDTLRFLALAVAVAALTACGFRLQGADRFPESMSTTYIDTQDRFTLFYQDLVTALEQGGVRLTSSPLDARTVIRIEADRTGRNVLTVSARNVPTEYDIYYTVSYAVYTDGEQVRQLRTLTQNQDYTYDANLVLGKNREEQVLRRAIAADLARQVSHELTSLP